MNYFKSIGLAVQPPLLKPLFSPWALIVYKSINAAALFQLLFSVTWDYIKPKIIIILSFITASIGSWLVAGLDGNAHNNNKHFAGEHNLYESRNSANCREPVEHFASFQLLCLVANLGKYRPANRHVSVL